jgi:hypothetical protein
VYFSFMGSELLFFCKVGSICDNVLRMTVGI